MERIAPGRSALALFILLFSGTGFAQTAINHVSIKSIVTGWAADGFGLILNATVSNPAGCPQADMVSIVSTDPGYKTFYAAALTAWSTNSPVTLIVYNDQCSWVRPKILGITLER